MSFVQRGTKHDWILDENESEKVIVTALNIGELSSILLINIQNSTSEE